MKICFKNAYILPNGESEVFRGDLLVENDKIEKIAPNIQGNFDRVIDATNKVIMAGFVNCHTHLAMSLFKGIGEDKPLEEWLDDMFSLEQKLTRQMVFDGTCLALLECIKNGITTVNDSYFFGETVADALNKMGVRGVVDVFINGKETDYEKVFNYISGLSDRITASFFAHSTYNADEELFSKIIKLAKKHNTFVSTHASETLFEVGECVKRNNLTPIGLMESYGFFDQENLIYHAVHLDKEDYDILNYNNANVCINSGSNLKLGSGFAPVSSLIKNGVNVCLGTDGSASNNRLDMFREMFLTATIQKTELRDASKITTSEILNMATKNGAKALGLDKVGELKEEFRADIIMLDLNDVNMVPCSNIKSNIVYACGSENVKLTMINGEILYENGQFNLDLNIEDLKERCKKHIETIKKLILN